MELVTVAPLASRKQNENQERVAVAPKDSGERVNAASLAPRNQNVNGERMTVAPLASRNQTVNVEQVTPAFLALEQSEDRQEENEDNITEDNARSFPGR